MSKKHWSVKDFIVQQIDSLGRRYGYCAKCQADMQELNPGDIRHYNSHRNVKRVSAIVLK